MKQIKTYLYTAYISSAIVFSSCATIFYGPYQTVKFNSNPPEAKVFVNGTDMGAVTPCELKIKKKVKQTADTRKNEQQYVLKKDGYYDYEYRDYRRIAWLCLYFDSFLFPIDLMTGSHLLYNEIIFGTLNPKSGNNTLISGQGHDENSNSLLTNSPGDSFDIDKNIPVNPAKNPYRFALVIGNEDYSSFQKDLNSEVNVAYAVNDASVFAEYAKKTLGVPDENVTLLTNAKAMDMIRALKKINLLSKNTGGKAEIFFYYAGHGLPDEKSKEPYLIPVDVNGTELDFAIKLTDIYKQLTEYPSKKITVFLDACFSGGARNQGLIAARGVKIKPKEGNMAGKMIVFSASSGDQSSLPYKEKKHGIFTYFLLKKLNESKGVLTYKALSDYLSEQVGLKSLIINNKEQNPQTNISIEARDEWMVWSFK